MFRSLIERLGNERDDDPRRAASYATVAELRDAVSVDLEEMLNTRSEGMRRIPEAFEQCRSSLLTFGISDYSSQSLLSPQDRDGIRRSLERAIGQHEKRLSRARVVLEPQREHERALRFRVDALLSLGSEREKVRFDAVLQLTTQMYALS